MIASARGDAGSASGDDNEAAEGDNSDNEGGGGETRRRSTPWKAEGRETADSRAEANDGSLDGLKRGFERKALTDGSDIKGEYGPYRSV